MTPSSRRTTASRASALALAPALAVLVGTAPLAAAADAASPEPSSAVAADVDAEEEAAMLVLDPRPGPPPNVTEGVPHIQLDQVSDAAMMDALAELSYSIPGVVEEASRASLPGARGLTLADDVQANPDALIVGREFAHIHADPGAGSLHLRLTGEDAAAVVASGWGEWHPFALDGRMPGMVMVYAPRDTADLEVVGAIIRASARHAIAPSE